MSEIVSKEIYKQIDEERIKKALEDGNFKEAFVLFKNSVLTKDEFTKLQQSSNNYGSLEEQMKDYLKETEKEKIEKAFKDGKAKEAEVLFKFANHLSEKEFYEMELKWRVRKKEEKECKQEKVEDFWEDILLGVKKEISVPSFETWFKQTKGELVDGVLVIGCDNSFQSDWLESRYSKLISEVAEKVLGTKCDLRFVK